MITITITISETKDAVEMHRVGGSAANGATKSECEMSDSLAEAIDIWRETNGGTVIERT